MDEKNTSEIELHQWKKKNEEEKTYAEIMSLNEDFNLQREMFSTRLANILENNAISTIKELGKYTPKEFRALRCCGTGTIEELEDFLKNYFTDKLNFTEKYIERQNDAKKSFADIFNLDMDQYKSRKIETYNLSVRLSNILKTNNINTIADLLKYTLEEYKNLKNCGKGTIEETYRFLEEVKKNPVTEVAISREYIEELINKIPGARVTQKYKPFLRAYTFDKDQYNRIFKIIENCGDKICDIKGIVINESYDYKELTGFLRWLCFDFEKSIKSLLYNIVKNERAKQVLEMRAGGETLEAIGKTMKVTRERVRQIELKVVYKFQEATNTFNVLRIISALEDGDETLTQYQIKKWVPSQSQILMYLLKKQNTADYIFDNISEFFVLNAEMIMSKVSEYTDFIPDVFTENEFKGIIKVGVEEYGIPEDLLNNTIRETYLHTGTTFHRTKLTLTAIYKDIMSIYYPNGLKSDDETLREFRRRIESKYGSIKLPENNRAIVAGINRCGILCGRGMYKIKQDKYISEKLLKKIHDYIMDSPRDIFLVNTIYYVFEKELISEGISNKYYMQGILHEEFENEFTFRRDYVSKTKNPMAEDIHKAVVEYIEKYSYPVPKEKIKSEFLGITDIVLTYALDDSQILNYFGEYLHSKNVTINNSEKEYMYNIISKEVSDGETHHIKDIFNRIKVEKSELLTRNYVTMPFQCYSLLEHIYGDQFEMKRPFVAQKGLEIEKTNERLLELIYEKDEISVAEIKIFAKENHMMISNIREYIDELDDKYIWKNHGTIANEIKLKIPKEDIIKLIESIYLEVSEKGPMLIRQLECVYNHILGNVKKDEWLIYSLIKKYSDSLEVVVTNEHFQKAIPAVGLRHRISVEEIDGNFETETNIDIGKVDTMDDLDDLLLEMDLNEDILL